MHIRPCSDFVSLYARPNETNRFCGQKYFVVESLDEFKNRGVRGREKKIWKPYRKGSRKERTVLHRSRFSVIGRTGSKTGTNLMFRDRNIATCTGVCVSGCVWGLCGGRPCTKLPSLLSSRAPGRPPFLLLGPLTFGRGTHDSRRAKTRDLNNNFTSMPEER